MSTQVLIDTDPWPKRIVLEINDRTLAKQIHAMANFVAGSNRYRLPDTNSRGEVDIQMLEAWRKVTNQGEAG